jgi:hypothetical protein
MDSTRLAVLAGLEALGWFDATIYDTPPGTRKHRPVRFISRPLRWDEPIEPNAVSVSPEDDIDTPQGLGGDVEDRISVYIDVFAEDGPVGMHLTYDIRDYLLGKYASTGQTDNWIDVYDFTQATPTPFTRVEIEDVLVDAAASQTREWQRNWWMIRADLVDDYADEFTPEMITNRWADVASSWSRIGGSHG